ncbi:MAG TPA: hypothetical protein VIF37_06215 [Methylobacter sp.]|jgi:hypothetical protein
MPLTKHIKKLKLVATGNFHEETDSKILPEFLHDYTVGSAEDLSNIYGGEWGDIQGNNYIFCSSEKECELFITSIAHVLLEWNENKKAFYFKSFFVNKDTDGSEVIDRTYPIKIQNESEKQEELKELKQLFLFNKNNKEISSDWFNDKIIKSVCSSQFGGCSFQMAIIGGTAKTPKYLLFSHLQKNSPLKNIVENHLKLDLSDVHICINQCFPDTDAINKCHYGFIDDPVMQKNTITLIRDKYFWLNGHFGGYPLTYSGYRINGNKLQAQYLLAPGDFFVKATLPDLQIHEFPIFNTLTVEQKNIIKKAISNKNAQNQALDVYFDLFKEGKLGDYYSIKQNFPDSIYYDKETDKLLEKQKCIEKVFIDCYKIGGDLKKLGELIEKPKIQKFITWKKEWDISELISCVQKFDPKVKPEEIFIDLSVGNYIEQSVNEIKKFELIEKSESKNPNPSILLEEGKDIIIEFTEKLKQINENDE